MIFGFALGRNMICSPDHSPLCPDTIMNYTSLEALRYSTERIYNISLLQSCYLCYECFQIYYMANQMQCKFKAAFALNFSEMLSQK